MANGEELCSKNKILDARFVYSFWIRGDRVSPSQIARS